MKPWWGLCVLLILLSCTAAGQTSSPFSDSEAYLSWSAAQADLVGKSTYSDGKVGSRATLAAVLGVDRGLKTERARNYKLRATWFTPEVIRASARRAQLRSRLTDDETRSLVAEAEAAGDTVILIEVDPNEGSGVIPPDWDAFLQPKGTSPQASLVVRGRENSVIRKVRALQGVMQRNYDYEQFWVVFPLIRADGQPVFPEGVVEAELVVRIYNKEGTVTWPLAQSIRERTSAIMAAKGKSAVAP
jgi:hypothetical protein